MAILTGTTREDRHSILDRKVVLRRGNIDAAAFVALVVFGGHGWKSFRKQDLVEGREYFQFLEKEVSAAMAKGLTLEEMKKTILLEPYKGWRYYEQSRAMNIEAMYLNLKMYR